TVAFSLFYSTIPIPAVPIVDDYLTACLLGGILAGIGNGIVLTCGGSGGGLDVVGLCLSKRGSSITVGKFSLSFNFFLYMACLFLFSPEVAIYSIIYNFFGAMVVDRMHQQNVNVQAMIFTREDEGVLSQFIIEKLGRSVTHWDGVGAYTGEQVHVLCVCLSKYEIEELLHTVRTIDPNAFLVVEEGVRVFGNFQKRVG
ncbi:MAG: YitT family protein, partial [Oscillibacter sp.]